MQFTIRQGMNQDILKSYPDNYFDSIVTDPPYGIEFLGKDWDKNTGAVETWEECFRVLKPGGHLLAFSAARTYHHLATNIEGVGFEIRDQIMWIYGSGFPKAQDIGKAIQKRQGVEETKPQKGMRPYNNDENKSISHAGAFNTEYNDPVLTSPEAQAWEGWKTALKPAHEPIVMARKPFKGSTIDNVLTHGVGALNIDATRIGDEVMPVGAHDQTGCLFNPNKKSAFAEETNVGRFPANVIGEIPEYQKYFYCPKVSRKERHIGFEKTKGMYEIAREHGYVLQYDGDNTSVGWMADADGNKVPDLVLQQLTEKYSGGNNHPTVKPVELMKYLVKLVTPSGGKVLDPFNGSGSTGMACVELGYEYVGCELDPNYVAIAERRITGWYERTRPDNNFGDLFASD